MTYSTNVKEKLFQMCVAFVEQRIAFAKEAMNTAQESANTEEKSSAGDKYETGRAMAQIERDQAAQQLDEALKLKRVLDQIEIIPATSKSGLGSLVITDQSRFYISISAGKLTVDGKEYLAVSVQSPIGKLLLNLCVGDVFVFNKQQHSVLEIH